jgi:predicted RNA polymerase sigma factor
MPQEALSITHLLADVLPTAGVGGLLALVMFYFYRQDAERHMKKFDDLIERQERSSDGWIKIVQDNTAALTRLSERCGK